MHSGPLRPVATLDRWGWEGSDFASLEVGEAELYSGSVWPLESELNSSSATDCSTRGRLASLRLGEVVRDGSGPGRCSANVSCVLLLYCGVS